jgi:hypothetical protein
MKPMAIDLGVIDLTPTANGMVQLLAMQPKLTIGSVGARVLSQAQSTG